MPATAPLRHLKECRQRKCNTGEIPHATLRKSICIFEEKVLAKNSCFRYTVDDCAGFRTIDTIGQFPRMFIQTETAESAFCYVVVKKNFTII